MSSRVDSRNLAAERGPAAFDARHRFTSLASFPIVTKLMAGTAVRVQSALPYTITTGLDNNGDTISNDRPAGVTRNSARGGMLVDIGARLTWTIAFGGPPRSGPSGPQVNVIRGGDADPLDESPQRAQFQRRRDVAVLRTANVSGRAPAHRA